MYVTLTGPNAPTDSGNVSLQPMPNWMKGTSDVPPTDNSKDEPGKTNQLITLIAVLIYETNKFLRQKTKLIFILCIIYSKEDIRHGSGNIGPHVHRTVRNGVDPDLGLGGLVGLEMVHIDMGQIVRLALDDEVGEIILVF